MTTAARMTTAEGRQRKGQLGLYRFPFLENTEMPLVWQIPSEKDNPNYDNFVEKKGVEKPSAREDACGQSPIGYLGSSQPVWQALPASEAQDDPKILKEVAEPRLRAERVAEPPHFRNPIISQRSISRFLLS